GNALKFYSSVRLDVRKIEAIEQSKDIPAIGNKVRVKVVKNKVSPPFRKVELELMFGKGISYVGSILDAAVKYDIIDKKGAWYSYGEDKIGQGKENVREYLNERPELIVDIEGRLRELMFPGREFPKAKAGGGEKPGTAKETVAKAAATPGPKEPVIELPEEVPEPEAETQVHRGPGRPRKNPAPSTEALSEDALF
ncbi:MAG: recombinase RecA, partial [Treponema sp.]|nr:recombinase RecA [Treponema sp.]